MFLRSDTEDGDAQSKVRLKRLHSTGSTTTGSDEDPLPPVVPRCEDSELALRFTSLIQWPESSHGREFLPVKLVTKAVKILRICKYETTDIATVLAVTYLHHVSFMTTTAASSTSPQPMSLTERAFLVLAQIYIAHCVVLDECCKVSNWHKYLFTSYCGLGCLNKAIAKILVRMDYSLWTDPEEVSRLSAALIGSS